MWALATIADLLDPNNKQEKETVHVSAVMLAVAELRRRLREERRRVQKTEAALPRLVFARGKAGAIKSKRDLPQLASILIEGF